MADHLKKVQPGDPLAIPAATFNTFIDAVRDFQARTRGLAQGATPAVRRAAIVLIRNDSGYDRGRFDVLGIDSPIITPTDNEDAFKNQVAFSGSTDDGSSRAERRRPPHNPTAGAGVRLRDSPAGGAIRAGAGGRQACLCTGGRETPADSRLP